MANRLRGQRRKITPHIGRKIFFLAGYGLTDQQIAEVFDISRETINEYKKEADYSDTLKRIKEHADLAVVNALYKNATGYEYTEQVATKDGDIVALTKHRHPDTIACIFWLKNRQRDKWRDKMPEEQDKEAVRNSVTQIFCNVTKKQQLQISRGSDPMDTLFGDSNKDEWNRDNRPAPAID